MKTTNKQRFAIPQDNYKRQFLDEGMFIKFSEKSRKI